jgi:heme/copper-type cytochrome/quinol oxidase subunit 3
MSSATTTTSAPIRIEPVPATRGYPTAWWGMVVLITTEAMVFMALLASYFFVRAGVSRWPPAGIPLPELHRSVVFSVILIASSIPIFWMEHALGRGRMRQVEMSLAIAFVMGAAFIANTAYDFLNMEFGLRENAYTSLFWVILGLHALHVVVGLLMSLAVQAKVWTGRVTPEHHVTPEVFALYWHFVDGVWIFVFASLFLSPHLGR